jgi:hypothetical protein
LDIDTERDANILASQLAHLWHLAELPSGLNHAGKRWRSPSWLRRSRN